MTVGRNDPCPCGSGRKYKACCLEAAEAHEFERRRLRRVEVTAVEVVLKDALRRFGRDMLAVAWAEFFDRAAVPEEMAEHPYFDTIFLSWALTDWIPDGGGGDRERRSWPSQPLILDYLDRGGRGLDAFETRILREHCRRPYSFYAVTGALPGTSLDLEDILTGSTHTVLEQSASQDITLGSILYGKVVTSGAASILFGAAPISLPPLDRTRLMDLRRDLGGRAKRMSEEEVRESADALRAAYLALAQRYFDPPVPQLQNTDGDPFILTTLHFDLACPPREAFDALRHLAHDESERDLLREANFGPDRELRAVRFGWTVSGNRVSKDWKSTVLGMIEVDGAALRVEVNSTKRSKQIRRAIEDALGSRVKFRRGVSQSAEQMFEQARAGPPGGKGPLPPGLDDEVRNAPEVRAMLREMAERHWESWLDEKIPALANKTPRQAARTPAGRERLEALLAEYALGGDRHGDDDPFRPDIATLRQRLGL